LVSWFKYKLNGPPNSKVTPINIRKATKRNSSVLLGVVVLPNMILSIEIISNVIKEINEKTKNDDTICMLWPVL